VAIGNTVTFGFYALIPISGWTENQNAPLLVGSVTSATSGMERLESAYITNNGTAALGRASSGWVTGVTRNSAGDVTITIASGIFTTYPICTCSTYEAFTNTKACKVRGANSSTSARFVNTNGSDTPLDNDIMIICMGPR
jgi:hypothetical protein